MFVLVTFSKLALSTTSAPDMHQVRGQIRICAKTVEILKIKRKNIEKNIKFEIRRILMRIGYNS
jgi:hypothetical protein